MVCGRAGFAEARLVLKDGSLHTLIDSSKKDKSIDFPWHREEADSTVSATLQTTTLVLEDWHNDGILPVLR